MSDVDTELTSNSEALVRQSEEIVRYRRLQRNIAVAVDEIALCLPMLDKYAKLESQMDAKKWVLGEYGPRPDQLAGLGQGPSPVGKHNDAFPIAPLAPHDSLLFQLLRRSEVS